MVFSDKPKRNRNRFVCNRGYVWIKRPDHPRAGRYGWVREHIVVLEEELGRYLLPNEVSHHKDGNTLNNDPSNLEVKTRATHFQLHRSGENHPSAKLTESDVVKIRATNGVPHAKLAEEYGVSYQYIYDIRARRRWRHVQ